MLYIQCDKEWQKKGRNSNSQQQKQKECSLEKINSHSS